MRYAGKALLLSLALWCAFWWGHLAGMRSAAMTFESSMRTDLSVMESLRDDQRHDSDHTLGVLVDRKRADVEYWRQATAPTGGVIFLLYPIVGPLEQKTLDDMRAATPGSRSG